uniref:Inversin-like n=1 Tax=Phallusia mammillata TaxID=59560 RepID=A0A6F9DEI9_9ASCI|nr:inversin-like [Phallusia mammillata]
MNFFRKLRKTNVTVLDDTAANAETVANSSGRSSSGLRRSGAISATNGYHDSETKLFVEAPIASTEQNFLRPAQVSNNQGYAQTDPIDMSATAAVRLQPDIISNDPPHSSAHVQFNTNNSTNNYSISANQNHTPSTNSDPPDENKVNRLMSLYAAIIRGEKSEVKKLLTANPDLLEAPDNFGRTALMYCVLADRLECAKLLLKMKCKLDQVDKAGRSALHLAAHKASYKFLELLHDRGGNIEIKDNDGQTPLHLTTRNRHARCLDFLLKRLTPGMVDVTDSQNRTALHWSAAFNNADYVKQLIKHDSNIAMPDAEGKTPLHWAANTHDNSAVATIKVILEYASSVLNWQDYDGRTALHFAVAHENVAAVDYLLKFEPETCEVDRLDNSFRTPLHWAAQLGNTQIVKSLLSVGAKNSITDSNGATPLLYAALNNHSDVILKMIEHDVNILEQADIEGRSALMWAAGKGATDVIQTLLALQNPSANLEKKFTDETLEFLKTTSKAVHENSKLKQAVDINRTDNKSNTALHMAAWNGHAHSAELLLRNGGRHDLQNNMRHTALFGACEKGHLNVVKHLLDYNASIRLTDNEERSPLHWAALGGHAEVCDLLIKKGLDPDLRDSYQRSPLHCAAFGGFINCMNLLLENRANVDLQDKEGLSALHWAAQSGQLDATKLLFQCSAFPNLMEFTEERLTPLDHALLNERDEVAQYLIEQGALSSETIRDIAAARIQACFKGFRVRKNFLRRKNLLMKHEMLRNKKGKRRPNNAEILEHLNGVSEEIVPKSPNADSAFADSLYSGDGSRQDQSEENLFEARTIKSTTNFIEKNEPDTLNPSTSDSSDHSSESAFAHGQQNEDPTVFVVPEIKIQKYPPSTPPPDNNAETNEEKDAAISDTENQDQENIESLPAVTHHEEEVDAKIDKDQVESSKDPVSIPEETPAIIVVESTKDPVLLVENEPPTPEVESTKDSVSLLDKDPSITDSQHEPLEVHQMPTVSAEPSSDDMLITDGHLSPNETTQTCDLLNKEVEVQQLKENGQTSPTNSAKEDSTSPAISRTSPDVKIDQSEVRPEPQTTPALQSKTDTSAKEAAEEKVPQKKPRKKKRKQKVTLPLDAATESLPQTSQALEKSENAPEHQDNELHLKENKVACQNVESPVQSHATNVNTEFTGKQAMPDDAQESPPLVSEEKIEQNGDENLKAKKPVNLEQKQTKRKDHKKKRKQKTENADPTLSTMQNLGLGDNEEILIQSVSGLAYKGDSAEPALSLHDSAIAMPTLELDPKSELSLSEYIESLMLLSPGERKALSTLQKNRKYAFKRANAAATTIQRAWRRYYKAKYPNKQKQKPKKRVKTKLPSKPTQDLETTKKSGDKTATSNNTKPHTIKYQVTRVNTTSATTSDIASETNTKEAETVVDPKFSVKVSKKKRPHTSHVSQISSSEELAQPTGLEMHEKRTGNNESCKTSLDSGLFPHATEIRKTKKMRPKTEHRARRSKLVFASQVDNSDDRLEQLCKIYGQTLVLQDVYYPTEHKAPKTRFRTVPAPSMRPKTSRAVAQSYHFQDEYDFMESVHMHDPITAVQTQEWKSSSTKKLKRNGSLQKSKATSIRARTAKKYRFQESEVASMPVQWQKIYSELKRTSMRKPGNAVPTRFSYNMRSSNF